jgi:hypothetical protein
MPDNAPAGSPCPRCGRPMVPIVYGYPTPETFESAERGEVVIGGCAPNADDEMCIPCRDEAWERFEDFSPAHHRNTVDEPSQSNDSQMR